VSARVAEVIHIIVPGPPPKKNERHRIVRHGWRGAMMNSDKHEAFCSRLFFAWERSPYKPFKIADGVWFLEVVAYWDKLAHKMKGEPIKGGPFPRGDFDAPLSSIADALQTIGAIDNDIRIEDGSTKKRFDKKRPRVEITLRRIR